MLNIAKIIAVIVAVIFTFNVSSAKAADTLGIIDISSRVNITNLDDTQVESFHIVTEFLVTKLQRQIPNIYIEDLSGDTTRSRLDEIYLQLSQGNCAEFKDSNCNYIVYGYLMNLTVSEGKRIGSKSEAVRADLSVRIVDVNTGKCVFVATATGISKAKSYGIFKYKIGQHSFSEEELHSALEAATDIIVDKIKKNI